MLLLRDRRWYKVQVSVHLGIVKIKVTGKDHKSYQPYIGDSKLGDQPFIKLLILHMLAQATEFMRGNTIILIESENFSYRIRFLTFMRGQWYAYTWYAYGISGDGKGEVDHVGGVAKVTILGNSL